MQWHSRSARIRREARKCWPRSKHSFTRWTASAGSAYEDFAQRCGAPVEEAVPLHLVLGPSLHRALLFTRSIKQTFPSKGRRPVLEISTLIRGRRTMITRFPRSPHALHTHPGRLQPLGNPYDVQYDSSHKVKLPSGGDSNGRWKHVLA